MARIRSVHPDLHRDATLADLSASAERTFVRLWCHLDDDGRAEDDLDLWKADLYPRHRDMGYDEIEADLEELHRAGLVIRYEVDGVRFLCCKPETWGNYQRPQKKQDSKLPGPDAEGAIQSTPEPLRDRYRTSDVEVPPVGEGRGVGDGEGVGGESTPPAGTPSWRRHLDEARASLNGKASFDLLAVYRTAGKAIVDHEQPPDGALIALTADYVESVLGEPVDSGVRSQIGKTVRRHGLISLAGWDKALNLPDDDPDPKRKIAYATGVINKLLEELAGGT